MTLPPLGLLLQCFYAFLSIDYNNYNDYNDYRLQLKIIMIQGEALPPLGVHPPLPHPVHHPLHGHHHHLRQHILFHRDDDHHVDDHHHDELHDNADADTNNKGVGHHVCDCLEPVVDNCWHPSPGFESSSTS